jgi:hypothetical protein
MKYIAQSRDRTLVGAEMPALTGLGRIGRYDVPLSARNQANFVMLGTWPTINPTEKEWKLS